MSSKEKILPITTHPARDFAARYSRDGNWIYFISNRSGNNEIWKIPAHGSEPVLLTKGEKYNVSESKDGFWLYYNKYTIPGLWCKPVLGGEEIKLLDFEPIHWMLGKEGIYYRKRSANTIEYYKRYTPTK